MTIIVYVFYFYLFFIVDLKAYLDPGTGSYLLQLLIAGFAGAILSLKIFWKNIRDFFKFSKKRRKKEQ